MNLENLTIRKVNGDLQLFSLEKLHSALSRSGASAVEINDIENELVKHVYPNMSTREIYKLAMRLLRHKTPGAMARFNLKKAILDLGPEGAPFEHFMGKLFQHQGFEVKVSIIMQGHCVTHEVDVVATKGKTISLVECKFHNQGRNVDVKIPLYIHARFQDLIDNDLLKKNTLQFQGWIATNSRFTDDAKAFAACKGMKLIGWNYPEKESLRDLIDTTALYPVTCLNSLTSAEKRLLLDEGVVLVKDLYKNPAWLKNIGVREPRMSKCQKEMTFLLQSNTN